MTTPTPDVLDTAEAPEGTVWEEVLARAKELKAELAAAQSEITSLTANLSARNAEILEAQEELRAVGGHVGGGAFYRDEHGGRLPMRDQVGQHIAEMNQKLAAAQEALVSVKSHAEALTEFRDYFTDRCEGLFFQFGMEVIDLYNATHGYEACRIEPDRAANPKDAP